jgi:hypothetical protein
MMKNLYRLTHITKALDSKKIENLEASIPGASRPQLESIKDQLEAIRVDAILSIGDLNQLHRELSARVDDIEKTLKEGKLYEKKK